MYRLLVLFLLTFALALLPALGWAAKTPGTCWNGDNVTDINTCPVPCGDGTAAPDWEFCAVPYSPSPTTTPTPSPPVETITKVVVVPQQPDPNTIGYLKVSTFLLQESIRIGGALYGFLILAGTFRSFIRARL